MGITIAQANAKLEDVSSVTAIVFCKPIPQYIKICTKTNEVSFKSFKPLEAHSRCRPRNLVL